MLKYRITKCLIEGAIYKCAILEGDEYSTLNILDRRRIIYTNWQGKECFSLPNMRNKSFFRDFDNRIADAVDEVINGNGDMIQRELLNLPMFVNIEPCEVLYFLDREYGEKMKQKYVKIWKNTDFVWVLRATRNNCIYVGENGLKTFYIESAKTFESEEDALKYLREYADKAYSYMNTFSLKEITEKIEKDLHIDTWTNSVLSELIHEIAVRKEKGYLFELDGRSAYYPYQTLKDISKYIPKEEDDND